MDFFDCYGAPATYLDYLLFFIIPIMSTVTIYLTLKKAKGVIKIFLLLIGLLLLLPSGLGLIKLLQGGIVMRCG